MLFRIFSKRTLLCLIVVVVFSAFASAQGSFVVSGDVKDSMGEPLPGVSIMVPNTKIGVISDADGKFSLKVNPGSTLRFSYIGFKSQSVKVVEKYYSIVMEASASELDQVVVTGYSQMELRKSTGAVAVVSAEDLKDSPLKSVDELLKGKLAGVNVQISSGRPGASAKVRIRGTNTITGNAEPLWVIDGVPLQKNVPVVNSSQISSGDFDNILSSGIGNINPNDIESISVLKDAAAAAIYGSKAANGVIVVTTKRGAAGKTHLSYMGSVSVQTKPSRSANLMNSSEKLAWEQELWDEFAKSNFESSKSGISAYYPVVGIVGQIRSGYGRFASWDKATQDEYIQSLSEHTTDWFDTLFRNSVSTSHHLSMSGGSNKIAYYVSGGYTFNNGLVVKTSAQSYNLNVKLDTNPTDWISFGVQADFSNQKANAPSNNVDMFKYAYFANPYERLYNDDGSYRADETYFSLAKANGSLDLPLPESGFNIMREINETSSEATSSMFTLTGNLKIKIYKGLNFTGLASYTYSGDMSENINGKNTYAAFTDRPFENDLLTSKRAYGSITQVSSLNRSYLLRGQFNYSTAIQDLHHISAIAGAEVRSSYAKGITSKRYGYDPVTGNHSTPLFVSNSGTIDYDKLVNFGDIMDGINGQSIIEDAFASFYGTATYNFDNRYIVSATIRSDGSNNFGSDEQFNANWSVSGAWNIDREKWMRSASRVLSSLGIRAGYGYTGGVNRSVYPVLIMNYSSSFRTTDDDFYRMGYINNAPNPNLRWEKNRTINVGIDYGFLNDRITGELAYYNNKNKDQVTPVRVPESTGFRVQNYNTSEQVNQGVEIMLSATILKIKDFRWRLTANASYNYNILTKYNSPTGSLLGDYYVGYPLGKIMTGKTTGINPQTGMYQYQLRPDAKIVDVSDYRKLQNYLYYVGTSNAPWTGGLSTSFSYKNLTLSLVGNFSLGGKVLNNIVSPASYSKLSASVNEPVPSSLNDLYVNHLNVCRDVVNRWTVTNPRTDAYPRIIDAYGPRLTDPKGNFLDKTQPYSTYITNCVLLENVSYFKLSSLSLSYSLPEKWARAVKMSGIGLSFLVNNFFVITNYSGIDPETPGAVYPQSRSFSFSLNCNF